MVINSEPLLHLHQSAEEIEAVIRILKRISETAEFSNSLVERTLLETGLELHSFDVPSSLFLWELCADLMNEKKSNCCRRILILDYEGDALISAFTSVSAILISECKGNGGDILRVFSKFVDLIVVFLGCNHANDLIEAEKASQNKFLHLLSDKNSDSSAKFSNKISCKNVIAFDLNIRYVYL